MAKTQYIAPVRRIGVVLVLAVLALPRPCPAKPTTPVWIVTPAAQTCVDTTQLLMGITNGGPFFPSLIVQPMLPDQTPLPVFQLSGTPERLRVQAWGVGSTGESTGASSGEAPQPALDETLSSQTCTTVSEAAVAFIVSVLSESPGATPGIDADGLTDAERAAAAHLTQQMHLTEILRTAQSEVGDRVDVHITTGAQGQLKLVLTAGRQCQHELPLDLVAAPAYDDRVLRRRAHTVRACVRAMHQKAPEGKTEVESTRAAPSPHTARATQVAPLDRDRGLRWPGLTTPSWQLPRYAPLIGMGLGAVVAIGGLQTLSDPGALLAYGAAPITTASVAALLVNDRLREPLLLSGYWLSVAGASVTLAALAGGPKDVLIGGALAGGSLASTALLVLSEASSPVETWLPLWAIAAPAVAGALAGGVALLVVDGGSDIGAELAMGGAVAAILPAAWLWLTLPDDHRDRRPTLGADRWALALTVLPSHASESAPSGALVSATGAF